MKETSFVDQPTDKDSLGIENYIKGLSNFIGRCATPLTIAIQGEWGTGKTSIMKQVKDILMNDNDCKVKTILFNTWQYSQFNMEDELAISLISDLTQELSNDDVQSKDVIGNVLTSLGLKTLSVLNVPGVDTTKISDILSDTLNQRNEDIKKLKDSFQKLVASTLKKENMNKLVIFIDDLDRLVPAKAVELLEVLKLFLDCEKCVFVLAIDYDVVINGVKNKYGEDVEFEKGRAFFDKLIQVPFTVPVSNYDIKKFLNDSFEKLDMSFKEDELKFIGELIKTSIGNNPRSINRLLNSFSLLQCILQLNLKNKQKIKKNRILLIALVCLQFSYEDIYIDIIENRQDIEKVNEILNEDSIGEDPEANGLNDFISLFKKIVEPDNERNLTENGHDNLLEMLELSNTVSSGNTNFQKSVQNHAVNEDVQYVIRKLFNDISKDRKIALNNPESFGTEQKEDRIAEVNCEMLPRMKNVRLTRAKGQGLNISLKDEKIAKSVYLAGDYAGKFYTVIDWSSDDNLKRNKDLEKNTNKEIKSYDAKALRNSENMYRQFFDLVKNYINGIYGDDKKNHHESPE